jgi:Rrf2 family protein
MKLLTRHSDYAVRALCYLAGKKRFVPVTELCRELRLTRSFLRNLLQTLSRKGFVKSEKGRDGGFKLRLSAANISLFKVMKVFQGPVELNKCTLKKKPCPQQKSCPVRRKIKGIEKRVIKELKSIRLTSFK